MTATTKTAIVAPIVSPISRELLMLKPGVPDATKTITQAAATVAKTPAVPKARTCEVNPAAVRGIHEKGHLGQRPAHVRIEG